jgi:hypothetical protein
MSLSLQRIVAFSLLLGAAVWYLVSCIMSLLTLSAAVHDDVHIPAADDCTDFSVMNAACVVTSVARAPDGSSCSSYVNCSDFSALLRVRCPLPRGSHAYPSSTCLTVGAAVALWFQGGVASLTEPSAPTSPVPTLLAKLDEVTRFGTPMVVFVFLSPIVLIGTLLASVHVIGRSLRAPASST